MHRSNPNVKLLILRISIINRRISSRKHISRMLIRRKSFPCNRRGHKNSYKLTHNKPLKRDNANLTRGNNKHI